MKKVFFLLLLVIALSAGGYFYVQNNLGPAVEDSLELEDVETGLENVTVVQNDSLLIEIAELEAKVAVLENETTTYRSETNTLLQQSLQPPYNSIEQNYLITAFATSDTSVRRMEFPISEVLADLTASQLQEFTYEPHTIGRTSNRVVDMRPFVDPSPFRAQMSLFSRDYPDDEELIYELWHMVTQFNHYTPEIGENPQRPLQTLLLASGDCEDSSILIASLLSAVERDWTVSFVYTDLQHPLAPQEINHILLRVDTPSETFFIETTNPDEINPHGAVQGLVLSLEA